MTPSTRLALVLPLFAACGPAETFLPEPSIHDLTQRPTGVGASAAPPPENLHVWDLGPTRRLVFSRSAWDGPAVESAVRAYLVCDERRCRETESNFMDFSRGDGFPETLVAYAIARDGRIGGGSPPLRTADALVSPPTPEARDHAPRSVVSPVAGPLSMFRGYAGRQHTDQGWSFSPSRDPAIRRAGRAVDDSWAWDVNLDAGRGATNLDAGMTFTAVGFGVVTAESPAESAGTYVTRFILVDHRGWLSGYHHAARVRLRPGDCVSPWTVLGIIGRSGTRDEHLRVAIYDPGATQGVLRSQRTDFAPRPVVLTVAPVAEALSVGQRVGLLASATVSPPAGMSGPTEVVEHGGAPGRSRFHWNSSAPEVATVNAEGVLLARRPGVAEITARYAGAVGRVVVTVR